MEGEEVVVEMTPEPDFEDVSVEEDTPVDEGEVRIPDDEVIPPENPTEKETPPPPPEPEKEPEAAEELERIRKSNATLAYNLRESQRRQQFLEQQYQQERAKVAKQALQDEHAAALTGIEHLKDVDPDAYIRERERLIEEKYRKDGEQREEASRVSRQAEEASTRRQKVEDILHRDFPEIVNRDSDLFKEARATIESRYAPEEVAHILSSIPQFFYDIVSETHARLRLKQMDAEKANADREKRINGQGNLTNQQKQVGSVTLTREQVNFCKEQGINPKEYAKFVAKKKGRR